jgi:hypothetical protein
MTSAYRRLGIVVTSATLLFATSAFAAGALSEEAVALADSAMKKIVLDDLEGAIEMLRLHSSIEWGELNIGTKRVVDAFRARPGGFGEPLGDAYVTQESFGETVLRVTFIQKFKRKPLRWDFFFCKPEQEWLYWSVRFAAAPETMFNLVPLPAIPTSPRPAR